MTTAEPVRLPVPFSLIAARTDQSRPADDIAVMTADQSAVNDSVIVAVNAMCRMLLPSLFF